MLKKLTIGLLIVGVLMKYCITVAQSEPIDPPYTEEAVTIENEEISLAGTLTLPTSTGAHPAVVLVAGSGAVNRDDSFNDSIPMKPFQLLADALARAGMAVLRYDKRGIGESTGDYLKATLSDFASDAQAALDYLRQREEVDADQVGVLGHSEGGLITAMLGAQDENLAFIIVLAGPTLDGYDSLISQTQLRLEAEGAPQDIVESQLTFVEAMADTVDDPQAMETVIYDFTLDQINNMPEAQRASLGDPEQYARVVAQQSALEYTGGWFGSFLKYDPAPDWEQTHAPILAFFGGKDTQVDTERNADVLQAALEKSGNEDFQIVVLSDANHIFQDAETGTFAEYASLPAEFTSDLLPTIIDWLGNHVDLNINQ